MNIEISDKLKQLTPDFHIGVIECKVEVAKNKDLDLKLREIERELQESINIRRVIMLDTIKEARDAYKTYGKDPSRYRLAVESLYRRLAKGNALYRINNVVDVGNLLSIKTRKSVAVLDKDKIRGDINVRLGKQDDKFFGIGRGKLDVENIPIYEDELGPFGSTTSDTERTMITKDTKNLLVFIISFTGRDELLYNVEFAKDLYLRYANATKMDVRIV
ncbi:MAG: hypothetical protein K9L74_06775 [Candidatus Izimaplasma sp.]|nr:hypothetical protein [Candidatus Izimaplasma bacterium]